MRSPDPAFPENQPEMHLATDTKLIRAALLMLLLLTAAFGGVTWNVVQDLSREVKAIPVALFAVVCIIVARMYAKAGYLSEVRERAHQLQHQQAEVERLLATVSASRESVRELIDSFGVAVFTLSLDGKVRTANKRFTEILERPFPQLIGSSIFDWIAEPSAKELEAVLPLFLENRHWSGVVRICLRSAREWRYFDCTLQPMLLDDEVVGITVIADDVTVARERQSEMERSLAREQDLRAQLIACLPDPVVTLDTEGCFTFATSRALELFGRGEEALIHSLAADCIDPQDSLSWHTLLQDSISRPGRVSFRELHLHRPTDGSWRTVLVGATALHDYQGQVRGVVASLRDVTDERQMEQHLIVSERMAAVGQMIEDFSYELNNPLTAILGGCELLKEAKLPSAAEHRVELLETQTRRACEIVHNLLLFSQPAADTMASVSLADLIHRTVSLRRHSLRAKSVTVNVIGGEAVPNAIGNPAQLMQAFMNLLVNAEQACSSRGAAGGNLRVAIGYSEKHVWCTFQDDGPGIDPQDRDRIFEPFFKSKRFGAGSGLGLSVCRSIVDAHGGKITACPAVEGGTVFCVTLPAVPQSSSARSTT